MKRELAIGIVVGLILIVGLFILNKSDSSSSGSDSNSLVNKLSGAKKFDEFSAETYCISYEFGQNDNRNVEIFDEEIITLIEKYDYTKDEAYKLIEDYLYDIEFQKTVLGKVKKLCPQAASSLEDRIEQLEQDISSNNQVFGLRCMGEGLAGDSKINPDLECCGNLGKRPLYSIGPDLNCIVVQNNRFVCLNCNDGECGIGENSCNCPEDCL